MYQLLDMPTTKVPLEYRYCLSGGLDMPKLEKEAVVKGMPLGQACDIEIPPPRPKRKPSSPYPRKTATGLPISSTGAMDDKHLSKTKQMLNLEHDPPAEEPTGTGTTENLNGTPDTGACSEVLSLFKEAPSASQSSVTKTSSLTSLNPYKEFVAREKNLQAAAETGTNKLKTGILNLSPTKEPDYNHTYPKLIPVHVVDVNCNPAASSDMTNQVPVINRSGGPHENENSFTNPTVSVTTESVRSSTHQSIPFFQSHFPLFHNNSDAYRSPMDTSSTFTSLVISALLQNPSVHAAASLAASYWPCPNTPPADMLLGAFPMRHPGPQPSLAAMAAATVAAACAWWASHGLIPFCPLIHPTFTYSPPPSTTVPVTQATQCPNDSKEQKADVQNPTQEDQCVLDAELSAAPKTANPGSKSFQCMSSDTEDTGGTGSFSAKAVGVEPKPTTSTHEQDKEKKPRKQVDRSSCGSNTASSSDLETDLLEKNGEGKEPSKEAELNHGGEPSNRRSRSTGSNNDSWKAVSEEGRLAFQALFSREVLPQSFSPPHDDARSKAHFNGVSEAEHKLQVAEEDKLELELGCKMQALFPDNLLPGSQQELMQNCMNIDKAREQELIQNRISTDKALEFNDLMGYGKLKSRRTGFKPYKRCSVEAKESSRVGNINGQVEEKGAKRIRLQGEAST